MMAKIRAASAPAPSTVPRASTRPAPRSALSGRTMAATTSAARPNVTSNQKIPRQLHTPTSAPPRTGPSASENPETAAQTPSARWRLRREAVPSVTARVSASATPLAPAGDGQLGTPLGVFQVGKTAEARDGHLPDAVQVDRAAYLVLQQRRAEQQQVPVHRGLRRRRDDDRADRRGRPH